MTTPDELQTLPLFEKVAEAELNRLLAVGSEVAFAPGDELWAQNLPADDWWVLLEGHVDLVRLVGREETVLGAMAPGRWAGGFRAWDEHAVYLATGRATTPGRVLRVAAEDLKSWTGASNPFGAHLIEGVFRTARTVETMARQREALVSLGTLAAGLAHELNNPAAAATRAVGSLDEACARLVMSVAALASSGVTAEQLQALDALRAGLGQEASAPVSALAAADREDALADWLADHDVDRGWELAPVLAGAGADAGWCERAAGPLGDALGPGLVWVAQALTVSGLLAEVGEATHRVSALVGAVKSYSQMDRASLQRTDVREGLDSTLAVLAHRLPGGVTVVRDYSPATPAVEAMAAELNQVWTHLVTNALDAMAGTGTLRLSTHAERGGVLVEVADTGTWAGPDTQDRAFEPFFTTKPVGQGTGLGLDLCRRVVVGRHGGDITVDRHPGETVLRVWLPGTHPRSGA